MELDSATSMRLMALLCTRNLEMKTANYHHHKNDNLDTVFGVGKWLYVGRAGNGFTASPLANPYPLKNGAGADERASVLSKYRVWLFKQIKGKNEAVMAELELIASIKPTLICYCSPEPCHADIIVKAVDHYFPPIWRIYNGQRKTYVLGAIKLELTNRHNRMVSLGGDGQAMIPPKHYNGAMKLARGFAEKAHKIKQENIQP